MNICRADRRETPGAIGEIINSKVKPPYFKKCMVSHGTTKKNGPENSNDADRRWREGRAYASLSL